MAEVELTVSDEVAAPAEAVWALVRDFGGLMNWSPGIEKCEVEGEGLGAVRTLAMAGGLALREKLEAFDDAERSFSYSIVEPSALPFTGYLARFHVRPLGGDRCRIDWSGRCTPRDGATADQARSILGAVYGGGIKAIKKRLE